jgi:hypothetical protein
MQIFHPGKIRRTKQKVRLINKYVKGKQKEETFTEIQYSNGLRRSVLKGMISYYRYTSGGEIESVRTIYPDGSIRVNEGNYSEYLTGNPFNGVSTLYRQTRLSLWIEI